MGLLPRPLPCHTEKESQSHSNELHSEPSASSLLSQSSLPSVPSLNQTYQEHEQPQTTNHQCIATVNNHFSVFSLCISGRLLYSGYANGEIRASSLGHPVLERPPDYTVASGNSAVKSLLVLDDKLFSAHQDHKIRVWKVENNSLHRKYECIATLPTLTDRFVKLFSDKNYVQVRRHRKCTWVHHVDTVSSLAISRDCSLLYSSSWDRTFKIWRISDFKCLESVNNAHDDAINAVVISNDGFVYTGSADNKIKVWNKCPGDKKHSLLATLEKHKSGVNALALSSDGSILYSGACDRSILAWNVDRNVGAGHTVAGALRGHTKAILCLGVVSDLVCSGSADNTVRIWRKASEKSYSCLAVLTGHRRPIKCLTATVEGNIATSRSHFVSSYLVYSGSLDGDIKIWKIGVSCS